MDPWTTAQRSPVCECESVQVVDPWTECESVSRGL